MGIDKPDVRFIINTTIPQSMEEYYQQCGRAGRDSERSECLLMYNEKDYFVINKKITGSNNSCPRLRFYFSNLLEKINLYCKDKFQCRRQMMLYYFGETFDRQNCIRDATTICDNCQR